MMSLTVVTTHRSYRKPLLWLVAALVAGGGWWVVWQGWYSEIVLIRATGDNLALSIDGEPAAPSERESGDLVYATIHPPIGLHRIVVSQGTKVLIDTTAELEHQALTTYVLFSGGGRWLAEHRVEYSNVPRPDFSAFDSGSQTQVGRMAEVEGRKTSFLAGTDDAAGLALLDSLGDRVRTQASLLKYDTKRLLLPFEEVPDSIMTEGGSETLIQLRVLSLGDVAVAERLRAAAVEDERQRAAAIEAVEGNSAGRPGGATAP
jgi:hypothetical protein